MSKPCIVCVDHEPVDLERLGSLLQSRFGDKHDIHRCSSSEECLARLEQLAETRCSVPLLLLDKQMTGPLGARLRELRHGGQAETPRVILLQKPWENESLSDFVEELLTAHASWSTSSRRRHAAEKKNANLEALHRIGVTLASSFDIDAILRQISTAAVSLLGNLPIDIYYGGSRTINAQPRWFPASPSPGHLPHDTRLRLEQAVAHRGTEIEPGANHQVIPIAVQDNLLGILVLRPSRPLRQEDRDLLSILSLQAATALHNIHLQQERIQFERLSAIGRMIGSVVHDFRSPLTAVRGYAGMLASLALSDDDRREYSQLIIEECDRLSTLTDELLELTRSSGSRPTLTTMELGDFFRQLGPSLEAQFKNSLISLNVELDYCGPVQLDANRMMRAVLNVATNARQAIEGAGSFTIRSKRRSDQVVLEFEDNGAGIPADVLHRIFEPFFSHGKAQGVGLGMSIIQKIVEEHGGETGVSSEPGVGTTIRFLLPIAEPSTEAVRPSTAELARDRRS